MLRTIQQRTSSLQPASVLSITIYQISTLSQKAPVYQIFHYLTPAKLFNLAKLYVRLERAGVKYFCEAAHPLCCEDKYAPRNAENATLSIFGGNDLDEQNEKFLELIDETLRPADGFGRPISKKIAKLINEKFAADLGGKKRKEISEKYKPLANCSELIVPKVTGFQ